MRWRLARAPRAVADRFLAAEALLDTEEYRGFPIVQTLAKRVVIGYIARLELQVALGAPFSFHSHLPYTDGHHTADRIRVSPEVTPTTPCYFSINPARGPQVGPNAPPPSAQPASGRERASEKKKGLGIGFEESPVEEQGSWVSLKDWVDEVSNSLLRLRFSRVRARTDGLLAQIPITMSQDTPMEVVVQMFQRLGLRSVLFTRQGALTGILTKMVRSSPIVRERYSLTLCSAIGPPRSHSPQAGDHHSPSEARET